MRSGTLLGPYEIVEPLGRGGMGEVYRAFDTRLQRYVAIKTLPPSWRDGRLLAIDPMFAVVRGEPRFGAVVARIQEDVAAMRARGDYSGLPSVGSDLDLRRSRNARSDPHG